jgi:hypothetical protein
MTTTYMIPGVGNWLGRSFRAVGRRWWPLSLLGAMGVFFAALGAVLVYAASGACVYLFTSKETLARLGQPGGWEAVSADPTFQALVMGIHGVAFLVALRIFCGFTLAAIHVATDHSLGCWQAMRLARKRSASFTMLTVVGQAVIFAGHCLLIVPGVIFGVYLSHAPFAFVRKETGVWESLRASWRAVSGHWWGVWWRGFVLSLVCSAIAIVPIAGWIVAPCLAMCAWAELYRDLTHRRPATTHAQPRPVQVPPRPKTTTRPATEKDPDYPHPDEPRPSDTPHVH